MRSCFSEEFKMDDRGAMSRFLGMQVKQSHRTVTRNQSYYIDDCLERFGLVDRNPVCTQAELERNFRRRTALKLGQHRHYP